MKVSKIARPKKTADALQNEFFEGYSLYRPPDGKTVIVNDATKEWLLVEKTKVCSMLRNLYYDLEQQTVPGHEINTVYEMISAFAEECQDPIDVVDLLYQDRNRIIYDIQGSKNYVLVTRDSVKVLKKSDIDLLFSKSCGPPVFPNLNYDERRYFSLIKRLFNVEEEQSLLFGVYIASLFVKNIHHPLLIIQGEYGAAKTTNQKKIAQIVNPHAGDISPMPKSLDDIATILHNNYLTIFDNISYVSRETADLLCLAVSGGSYQKRKLYTNDEVSSVNVHRPVALNGMNLNLSYSDLMDRSILINLKRISENDRKTEEEVWKTFYACLPDLQGCIFKLLGKAMRKYESTRLQESPRLADFAKWGYAIAESVGAGLGVAFLRQYNANIEMAAQTAIDHNPILSTLQHFMDKRDSWEGTSTELLRWLKAEYCEVNATHILPRGFPSTANVLSRRLNTLQNDLKHLGYRLDIGRDTHRYITIKKVKGEKANE